MKIKTLTIVFYNSFTGDEYSKTTMPYDRTKAKNGYYTRYYRIFKREIPNMYGFRASLLKAKIITS